MSKVGLYSSDRKKVADVDSDTTLTQTSCGHVIMLDSGSAGDGSYTITLPKIAAAGPGWWCKLIVRETTGGAVTISASADDLGSISVHKVNVSDLGMTLVALGLDTGLEVDVDALLWQTASWCQNDTLELVTDGVTWGGQAICSASISLIDAP